MPDPPISRTPPAATDAHRPAPERREVLAASAPWLGALLNLLPGLGAGYLYQRRWRAWWISTVLAAVLLLLSRAHAVPMQGSGSDGEPRLLAAGLLLATVTALEAFLAARRARID